MKAVIFDFDGVVVDSEPLQFESLRKALEELGYEMTKERFIREWVLEGCDFKEAVERYKLECSAEELRKRKFKHYAELIKGMKMRDHARELIQLMKENYKTAVATNSNRNEVELILKKFAIEDMFDIVVAREDYKNKKPNPDCLLVAAKRLGVEPDECIVIEDSPRGVRTANNAGIRVIAVPNEFTKDGYFSKADLIVKSLNEITIERMGEL
ncbi:HAD family phosphatase [Candidatus Woesearchaeota archaeon]|nr:HAD family phosphatase [Candidatus Woesearchaeota archaeon]